MSAAATTPAAATAAAAAAATDAKAADPTAAAKTSLAACTQKITPFLMFTGRAEEAMNYYIALFKKDSSILAMKKYPAGAGDRAGKVIHATFQLNGLQLMAIDAPPGAHAFGITPAVSLYIRCESKTEIDTLWAGLNAGDGTKVLMALDAYSFSERYGWVTDKFGVSWQLEFDTKGN